MDCKYIELDGFKIRTFSYNTVIVGTGASGFNAADRLYKYGQTNIAIITEGINMGTSRNTGSDKQTYYKVTTSGMQGDSIYEMAETLFKGGAMDGDLAMVESALSAKCFYRLEDIGVPFPHNLYGEYIGYKTDHDPRKRATSAGPLTSKFMTEKLEEEVMKKQIEIFNGFQVVRILTDKEKTKAIGLLAIDKFNLNDEDKRYVIFNTTNIVYATGGSAGMYSESVYPVSHTGGTGIAFAAGAYGRNLTESQYGIASIKFRWNLSGTYQQVIPRYISTDKEGGDEKEFLIEYFNFPGKMLDAIFLKGYQWPFDPRKIEDFGSSFIDILVYNEIMLKGRRVFLDYTKNPTNSLDKEGNFDFSLLGSESYEYLEKSNALFGTPIDRLKKMNEPAIMLYKNNGIDLSKELLEVSLCAQHNNGGLYCNIWWESNLKHFFPVGEAAGTHGVYRPGGSALNSGQVGSTRAAEFIYKRYNNLPMPIEELIEISKDQVLEDTEIGLKLILNIQEQSNIRTLRTEVGKIMSECGAAIRDFSKIKEGKIKIKKLIEEFSYRSQISSVYNLPYAYKNKDILMCAYVYLSAIEDYIEHGGTSRGSYLICNSKGIKPTEDFPESLRFTLEKNVFMDEIQITKYLKDDIEFSWEKVKALPSSEEWFEKVWNDFRNDEIVKA